MAETEVFLTISRMFVQGSKYFVTLDNKEVIIEVQRDKNIAIQLYHLKITLPFILDENIDKPSKIKGICVAYLNRLIDVVRHGTKFYFIERISENDFTNLNFITTDDNGKRREGWAMDMSGPFFPLNSIPETDVEETISSMLKNGDNIPLSESMMLGIFVLDVFSY